MASLAAVEAAVALEAAEAGVAEEMRQTVVAD